MRWYVDTSAAAKLLFEEAESRVLDQVLSTNEITLVACLLLEIELRRLVLRENGSQADVTTLLDTIELAGLPAAVYRQAGLLPGTTLRSLDAIHLASALALGVDAVLTYDTRMTEAAHAIGIAVEAPGASINVTSR